MCGSHLVLKNDIHAWLGIDHIRRNQNWSSMPAGCFSDFILFFFIVIGFYLGRWPSSWGLYFQASLAARFEQGTNPPTVKYEGLYETPTCLKGNWVPFVSSQNSYAAMQMRIVTLAMEMEQHRRDPLTSSLFSERKIKFHLMYTTLHLGFSS